MQNQTEFEKLARECGDAMLVIRLSTDFAGNGVYTVAIAVAGAFAVTQAQEGDIPLVGKGRGRHKSKTRRFMLTHAATGLKVGVAMTKSEAMRALVALRDVPAGKPTEIQANRDRILDAIPVKYGVSRDKPVNSEYEKCVAPERAS